MGQEAFEVTVAASGARPVVTAIGELDMYSGPRLREVLVGLADAGNAEIEVDLGGLTFIDSSGLGVIVGALKRCRMSGGDLVLRNVNDKTAKVLAVTGLDRVLTVTETSAVTAP